MFFFFFQAEDGIRDAQESRGLEMCIRDRRVVEEPVHHVVQSLSLAELDQHGPEGIAHLAEACLLYTSDAADDLLCVDLGGRRILKKKNKKKNTIPYQPNSSTSNHQTCSHHPTCIH